MISIDGKLSVIFLGEKEGSQAVYRYPVFFFLDLQDIFFPDKYQLDLFTLIVAISQPFICDINAIKSLHNITQFKR